MANLKEAIANLEEETAIRLLTQKVEAGDEPSEILEELRNGMEVLGQRFADCEYSLGELIMGAEIFKECMDIIKPSLEKNLSSTLGRVVIGTVKGDIHDLGKNIVASMFTGAGFDVHDVGVDIPPERFIEKIREVGADIVGLSCLLTSTLESMRNTVSMIRGSGLNTKIMVGGGVFSRGTGDTIIRIDGADGFGKDAIEAVNLAREWVTDRS